MKKLIALLLTVAMMVSFIGLFTSCAENNEPNDDSSSAPAPETDITENETESDDEKIELPEYKDHNRGTINFFEIKYTRPSVDKTISDFSEVARLINENPSDSSYQDQLKKIRSLEEGYNNFLTMRSYANIKVSENSADTYWAEEYEYTSVKYPAFAKAIEDLFVAAAKSPYAESFEADYFGDGFIEEYKDGGKYTDELIQLMETEAALEAEYSSLSTSNVIITFEDMTDTPDNILAYYAEEFGKDTAYYALVKSSCSELYEDALAKRSRDIFVDLIKTRRLIADEYSYSSYIELAYEEIYHDYSQKDTLAFIDDISKYIVPVYFNLSFSVFLPFFYGYSSDQQIGTNELINDFGALLEGYDSDLYEIYSYMLQHELYNCKKNEENRYEGSFATYLDSYNAPYLFATLGGNTDDYMTLSHEFGHFADSYMNYGSSSSLDLMEISSSALEMLTLSGLKDTLSESDYKYLTYAKLDSAMQVLIYQGFYALFEHYVYEIPYAQISEESLLKAAKDAAERIGIYFDNVTTIDPMIIPHTVLYPSYVQSYCTSAAVSMQIYFKEIETSGSGIEIYKDLIYREDDSLTFEEYLAEAEIDSPFENESLKDLANKIYYHIIGSNYFVDTNDDTVV